MVLVKHWHRLMASFLQAPKKTGSLLVLLVHCWMTVLSAGHRSSVVSPC
jgi:hypothetical protein